MACEEEILSNQYKDFIFETNSLAGETGCVTPAGLDYSFVYKAVSQEEISRYRYSEIPKLYSLMDNVAVENAGAARLQNLEYLRLRGNGILIGIIDNGIDVTHKAFRFTNGNTRVRYLWNQSDASGNMPEGYYYGREYTQEELNAELQLDNSEVIEKIIKGSAHGTHMAGIASGNIDSEAEFASPAPGAELVVVKLKQSKRYLKEYFFVEPGSEVYQENDIINGINYVLSVATKLKKPVVIPIGLGTNQGAHSGLSLMGDYLDTYSGRTGVGIVCANGNEGNERHHYLGNTKLENGYESVQIHVGKDKYGFSLELWGQSPDIFEVEIISPTGEVIRRIPSSIKGEQIYRLVFEETSVFIKYELVERITGQELILMRFQRPTEGIWTIKVFGVNVVSGLFNMWLPVSDIPDDDTYFLESNPFTTVTVPADAFVPISVGAYNNITEGIYIDSGRGYPTNGTVKPSFVAPGVNLIVPSVRGGYANSSGTSIATGLTAGVMAQFLEWGIIKGNQTNMNTTQIKNFLIRGANRKSDIEYPNEEFGYGTLNAYGSIDVLRR